MLVFLRSFLGIRLIVHDLLLRFYLFYHPVFLASPHQDTVIEERPAVSANWRTYEILLGISLLCKSNICLSGSLLTVPVPV